ncbi:histidine phosphotransferase ChpT [Sagittula marina]|uniref:Histidine phosphotransferase ChpT n=1 Tax=Sagittula marina TaxID=943940 RepID=A0A7W6DTP8_9RHOB|nr:histidine phosphotransferase family protein [Sagittula marina]MBB3987566.1 histidine phosphotransferase ChpT [Sagittula marina]
MIHVTGPELENVMQKASVDLAALVGSRLCHDLISPIGAIQNGLELMALTGGGKDSPELTLIQDSCESAAARIRFFRVAFGHASGTQSMSRREIAGTLAAVTHDGRLKAHWSEENDHLREEVQMCFLAFLCCESALPMGGTVQFDHDAAGWTVRAKGPRLNVQQPLWDHLNGVGEMDLPGADKVQFALLPMISETLGKQLLATTDADSLTIKIAA